jgi:hypothetical protein
LITSPYEEAWNDHAANWKPHPYQSQLLNEEKDTLLSQHIIPTQKEWLWPNVQLWCRSSYLFFEPIRNDEEDEDIDPVEEKAKPCHVIGKNIDSRSGSVRYMAVVVRRKFNLDYLGDPFLSYGFCAEFLDQVIFNLPNAAFIYGNGYTWDEHLLHFLEPYAFRHDLRIPDHLMPNKWKNLL